MLFPFIISIAIFIPSIVFYVRGKEKEALWLLLIAACYVRLVMISLDPYLHDWDERFHAVVAKNMMGHPFQPMMRLEAILPYKADEWCCNYIWVHKQPLFLWQMALSMKIFGVNTIALRLPNVLMGTFIVYAIYRMAKIWTNQSTAAYLTALLFAASYYNLELCSGHMSLDHNDLMMGGYVTASFWAFCEYTVHPQRRWIILTGVFVGCAVLTKWLTGLLVFGGWGCWLLLYAQNRFRLKAWGDLLTAILVSVTVFLPWQLYIRWAFPVESAAASGHNWKHIFENLGHPGDMLTHIQFMTEAYSGKWLLVLMAVGFLCSWQSGINRRLSAVMAAMFLVVYAFFSLIVATKMRGLTFPAAAIGFVWIGLGLHFMLQFILEKIPARFGKVKSVLYVIAMLTATYYTFQPKKMTAAHADDNPDRLRKMHNTAIYKSLNNYVTPQEVVLNCKSFEDTEVRFWQPNNAYHWYPTAQQVDSLLQNGYQLCAFKSHTDQGLPEYIEKNPKIKILDLEIK